jgi:hypothetical protein
MNLQSDVLFVYGDNSGTSSFKIQHDVFTTVFSGSNVEKFPIQGKQVQERRVH